VASTDELLIAEIGVAAWTPTSSSARTSSRSCSRARDEDGEAMTDREIRDELITLLLAGHETTATALAWAFDHLFHRPDALERLTRSAATAPADSYLDAVIKETLRLRPPVPIVDRTLGAPLRVERPRGSRGTTVAPCIYLIPAARTSIRSPTAFSPSAFSSRRPETYSCSHSRRHAALRGASFATSR